MRYPYYSSLWCGLYTVFVLEFYFALWQAIRCINMSMSLFGCSLWVMEIPSPRDFFNHLYFKAFPDQTPIICLNFFWWVAKDTFKREMPGFPSFNIPLAYPFHHNTYGDTHLGDEIESMRTILQCNMEFKGSVGAHETLMPLALYHNLVPPCPKYWSPPPLNDQTIVMMCVACTNLLFSYLYIMTPLCLVVLHHPSMRLLSRCLAYLTLT